MKKHKTASSWYKFFALFSLLLFFHTKINKQVFFFSIKKKYNYYETNDIVTHPMNSFMRTHTQTHAQIHNTKLYKLDSNFLFLLLLHLFSFRFFNFFVVYFSLKTYKVRKKMKKKLEEKKIVKSYNSIRRRRKKAR